MPLHARVGYPYTRYCTRFSYTGRHHYFITCVTYDRTPLFERADVVALVWAQILRAAMEKNFDVAAYCFMPDHVHLVVEGIAADSDLKAFVKLAKQYAGYYFKRACPGAKLWQHGTNDHIIRDGDDLLDRVRYVVNNPVVADLVTTPEDYPFLGSQRFSVHELMDWCNGDRGQISSLGSSRL